MCGEHSHASSSNIGQLDGHFDDTAEEEVGERNFGDGDGFRVLVLACERME